MYIYFLIIKNGNNNNYHNNIKIKKKFQKILQ